MEPANRRLLFCARLTLTFKCLDLSTKEYELLKFFDIRLEEYIRRYLFDGFFGRILEHRGNGVYPANISSISSDKHYRNSEFEKIVPFEFVVESIINGKLIGVRYSDFAIGDIQIADNIDEVFVLTWGSIGGGSQQSKIVLDNGTIVYHSCLREFMVYLGFSPDEYSEYVTALYGVIDLVLLMSDKY